MTKLEEKLIELGYELDDWLSWSFTNVVYSKKYERHNIVIYVNKETITIKCHRIIPIAFYNEQQDINDLQQAFNQLQQDLEVLNEYEENN